MKLSEAIGVANGIAAIQNAKLPAPAKFGFALAMNAKKLGELAEQFEASRQTLIDKYAEKDADGNRVITDTDGQQSVKLTDTDAFTKEIMSLAEQDVEVSLIKVNIEDFGSENVDPSLVVALLPMINTN